jgi:Holliday junction resolvasome RuvABC ATP-dependent DNA helicase subunit
MISFLSSCTDGIPRKAKTLAERLEYVFPGLGTPKNLGELQNICKTVLDIDEQGLDRLQRLYLEFLQHNRRAGLDTISLALRIPKTIILRDIEPGLLYRDLIEINSNGRMIK